MAEHEKELLEKFAEAMPTLTDYEKGYINGVVDNAVGQFKAEKEQKNESEVK